MRRRLDMPLDRLSMFPFHFMISLLAAICQPSVALLLPPLAQRPPRLPPPVLRRLLCFRRPRVLRPLLQRWWVVSSPRQLPQSWLGTAEERQASLPDQSRCPASLRGCLTTSSSSVRRSIWSRTGRTTSMSRCRRPSPMMMLARSSRAVPHRRRGPSAASLVVLLTRVRQASLPSVERGAT